MPRAILKLPNISEHDVVAARQYARQISALLGYDPQDQTRIATAVSEISRNASRYARDGEVEFAVEGDIAPQLLLIRISDKGPGIRNLDEVLEGRYRSQTGMGMGIVGARRLMDQCELRTSPAGTEVLLKKIFPARAARLAPENIEALARSLATRPAESPFEEIQQQNRELVRTLNELRERKEELSKLNGELEDTNRGVVALYAELDEKADHLRRADEMKTRFLSNMSHEFRTPLNSIRALSRILLARADGELTDEQEKQVRFIDKAADDLRELVDDLLDLAKIEAGKIEIHPADISPVTLFSALRGMLRPLLVGEAVALHFVEPADVPQLYTDEGKLSQILRNFISNALKFTERGEIRVTAAHDAATGTVTFAVCDTGIGIREEDQAAIFDEFTQIRNPLQTRAKGTGLGLPLCRKLAHLLGGTVSVVSAPGVGSTFSVTLPVRFEEAPAPAPMRAAPSPLKIPVLVVEDDEAAHLYYAKVLRDTCYEIFAARNLREAQRIVQSVRPAAVVLDILLRGENSWRWLGELKTNAATRAIPVIVVSTVNDASKGYMLGADACLDKPVAAAELLARLDEYTRRRVLLVEDEVPLRYTMKRILEREYVVMEAANGREGLAAATTLAPSLVILDLGLPDIQGEQVLAQLRSNPATAGLPVLIATSRTLSNDERASLKVGPGNVMSKSDITEGLLAAVAGALPQGAPPT